MHVFAVIFLSIAVIFVTALTFVGWLVVSIIRGTMRLIAPKRPRRLVTAMAARFNPTSGPVRCSRENCRNFNPPNARFCRCCGANLMAAGQAMREPMRDRMTA